LVLLAIALLATAPIAVAADTNAKRPNVLIFLIDDGAFMDLGTYGGEARTPTVDRLAKRGALFASHHTSPLCSPSRAMLLTGLDNHKTGVATIEEVLPPEQADKPGYSLHLEPGVLTIADRLKSAGYRTYMSGKWHLGHGPGQLPNGHGFDRSLALDASGADNWAPKPYMPYYQTAPWFEDGEPATMPDSYYSSELIVDRMLQYLQADAQQSTPFLAYVAFQAIHIPVQAPKEFIKNYEGRFDAGWDVLRRERWQRAKDRGLIPPGAPLDPEPSDLKRWDSLTDDDRKIYAQSMAVYSGMIEAMDFHIGRLVAWLEKTGQLDNTIIVVTSDNGPEPSDPVHTPGMPVWMRLNGYSWTLDGLGGPGSLAFIGPEWAAAVSSPGRLFKFYAAEGGLRVPFVIAGPGITAGTGIATPSFVTDVTPTILDLAGVPTDGGVKMTGRTLRPVLSGQETRAYPIDVPVGIEVSGNSALFKGDWKLVRNMPPFGDGDWKLHELALDPGETKDLSSERADLKAELLRDYQAYEREMGVQPLPPGYDPHKQVARNAIKRQIGFFKWHLTIAAAALIAITVLLVRRRRRRRRSRIR
jgi:arylsulfatase A-like enzyme